MRKLRHVTTDPVCLAHRAPTGWVTRRRFDRNRGRACIPCLTVRSALSRSAPPVQVGNAHESLKPIRLRR